MGFDKLYSNEENSTSGKRENVIIDINEISHKSVSRSNVDYKQLPQTKKRRKRLKIFALGMAIAFTAYLVNDFYGPGEILLTKKNAFGFEALCASELIVQDYDRDENLYATRGMILYKLPKGGDRFKKVAQIPTGFNLYWLRNFSLFRKLTLRPECVEVVVKPSGNIVAMSAGKMWALNTAGTDFTSTLDLTHYGKGDQGIFENGILSKNDSTVFFGEYFRNEQRDQVRIYGSYNAGKNWDVRYTFKPGEIRHIHALMKDPYEDKLWICTGDDNGEPRIAWTDDDYKTIHPIGQGSQMWRATQLIFDKEYIYWGADTYEKDYAGIYRWHRQTRKVEKISDVDGAMFHATKLKNGTIIMNTSREGGANEKDEKTRMFVVSDNGDVQSKEMGTWERKSGFWFKYAKLRTARGQGASSLALTCLMQEEFPNAELIIIPQEQLTEENIEASAVAVE
jgi:hypothetical protein